MRVKQRLRIMTVLTVLSVIVLIAALLVTAQRVRGIIEQNHIADALITASFERIALRTDYMRTGSERARQQVKAKNEQVDSLLKSASKKFTDAGDKKTISELLEGQDAIGQIFEAIVANRNNSALKSRNAALSSEVESRLLNQLEIRVYESVLLSTKLQDSTNAALVSSLGAGGGSIAFVFLLMGAVTLINSIAMNRAIANRIRSLSDGASAIGAGNLDHRIDIKGDDEFAELSDAFNEMTAKLKTSYNDLENENAERKRAEAAVRESELFYRQTLESIPGMVFTTRPDGYCDYQSQQWVEYTGIPVSEHLGDGWNRLLHPDDRPRAFAAWRAAVEGTAPYDLEYRVRRHDGVYEWFKVAGRPIRDGAGLIVRWFGIALNIEQLKRAEEALSKSEEKFRGLFNWMGEAIQLCELVWDEQGQPVDNIILDVNPAYENETGLTREQVVGRRIKEILPVVEQAWLDRYGEILRTRKPIHFEEYNASVDRWFEVFASPMEGNQFAVVFGNITDRKRADEALKASLREKEVLLKEIHHRVKNNLQVISSLVGLQAGGSRDETVRGVLRDVTDRVRSMALVHEKLYQSADLAHIDFAEYTRSLLSYLWRAYGADTVRLTLDLEPVTLSVDKAVPCGLILNELAGNALKHAFRGRTEGEVAVSLHGDIDGRICLRVSDNGVGLPPGFDWRQARSLGLRLVQMLAGQMDATVEVHDGEGARFELVFGHPGSG